MTPRHGVSAALASPVEAVVTVVDSDGPLGAARVVAAGAGVVRDAIAAVAVQSGSTRRIELLRLAEGLAPDKLPHSA